MELKTGYYTQQCIKFLGGNKWLLICKRPLKKFNPLIIYACRARLHCYLKSTELNYFLSYFLMTFLRTKTSMPIQEHGSSKDSVVFLHPNSRILDWLIIITLTGFPTSIFWPFFYRIANLLIFKSNHAIIPFKILQLFLTSFRIKAKVLKTAYEVQHDLHSPLLVTFLASCTILFTHSALAY